MSKLRDLGDDRPPPAVPVDAQLEKPSSRSRHKRRQRSALAAVPSTASPAAKPTKMGRPSIYTDELREHILTQVRRGRSLTAISHDEGMPSHQTMYGWLATHRDFLESYERAMEIGAHAMVADAHAIVDNVDTVIAREEGAIPNSAAVKKAELQSRFRQWLAGKWNARYREKTELELSGKAEIELGARLDAAQRRLAAIDATATVVGDAVTSTDPTKIAAEDPLPKSSGD